MTVGMVDRASAVGCPCAGYSWVAVACGQQVSLDSRPNKVLLRNVCCVISES